MSILRAWLLNGVYLILILIASPWIVWAALKHGKYREGFSEKLFGRVPLRSGNQDCVWLHAVSVGEVNLLATTLAELQRRNPDLELVISTTTKAGYDLARCKYADHTVFYCPLDLSWAVHIAMRRIRPNLLVLAELELWPNLIQAAKQSGAAVAIINGRMGDKSFRGYHRLRLLVGPVLRQLDLIAAQNEEIAVRFRQCGAEPAQVVTTGSLKFDGAQTDRENTKTRELRSLAGIEDDAIVFLAGSTQDPEEIYVLEIFQTLVQQHPKLRLILVPRHPQRFEEVAKLLDTKGVEWQRRSKLEQTTPNSRDATHLRSQHKPSPRILLVDTVGELGAWWGTATIGFVGGTFGSRGGQNMLEPAAYGVATCFGPNTWNFRDIVAQLGAAEGVKVVQNREELLRFVRTSLEDPQSARQLGQRARDLVLSQQGATERTVDLLLSLMASETDATSACAAA